MAVPVLIHIQSSYNNTITLQQNKLGSLYITQDRADKKVTSGTHNSRKHLRNGLQKS